MLPVPPVRSQLVDKNTLLLFWGQLGTTLGDGVVGTRVAEVPDALIGLEEIGEDIGFDSLEIFACALDLNRNLFATFQDDRLIATREFRIDLDGHDAIGPMSNMQARVFEGFIPL